MNTDLNLPLTIKQLESFIKSKFEHHSDDDLIFSVYTHHNKKIVVCGIDYLVDHNKLENMILSPLLEHQKAWTSTSLLNEIPVENGTQCNVIDQIEDQLINGSVFIYIENGKDLILYPLMSAEERNLDKSETESVIIGPQLSFTESLNTNLNLIRQVLPTTDLVIEKLTVGTVVPREVRIIYMKSVANEADVNTMRQRIQDVDVEEIEDSTTLKQYIEDSSLSLFPQFVLTELPALLSYTVKAGKVGVLVENSPNALIAPSTFFSFFETTEDNYLRWIQSSAFRLLRMFSILIALLFTPLYVAIITYQYELIPTSLLVSIGQSRAGVPFPPIIEALLIELMIELLRESSARLPTKIGETMGIVGGIVIGQASVEAGIASNILIIIVAASTLASFTAPDYLMGTAFRVIRFPMILLAGLYGLIGVMFGICFLLIHLLRTKSLGRPYLAPLYPFRPQDFSNVFFHAPAGRNGKRASMYRPKDDEMYSKEKAIQEWDIEE